MVKIFEILRRASTEGHTQRGGMVAVRSNTRASHRVWEETTNTPEGQELKNAKLRTLLRKHHRINDAEWDETGLGEVRVGDYVVVDGTTYTPKQRHVASSGEEVKEEVHRQATKINSTHRTDVSTLRKLLTWIRPAREQPDVDVARDLCGWEACDAAISRGFKRRRKGWE